MTNNPPEKKVTDRFAPFNAGRLVCCSLPLLHCSIGGRKAIRYFFFGRVGDMLSSSARRIGAGSTRAPSHEYRHMPAAALQNIADDMLPHEEHNPPLPLACASASSAVAQLALLCGMCQAEIAKASLREFNESWAFPGENLSHDFFFWKTSRATSRCSSPVMRGHDLLDS